MTAVISASEARFSSDETWPDTAVGDVCHSVSVGIVIKPAQYYTTAADGIRAFRSANVSAGKIVDRDWVFLSRAGHAANAKSALKTSDVIVVRSGAPGTACVVTSEYDGANCIDLVIARPDPRKLDPYYLAAFINSAAGMRHVTGTQGGLALKHFNVGALKEMVIPLPPVAEQRRIAAVLKTWDDALDALGRLRLGLVARRAALRRAVFGEPHAGDHVEALSEITTRITRGSDAADHPLMTIASQSGFVLQSDKYARDMAGESAESYTLLRRGEFAYNKGNSLTYPQGCVFRLERESALVPFVYFCFALNEGLNPDYYAQLFAAGYLNPQLARMIKTGVRNNGLLNINAEEFFTCTVPVPGDNQQAADAAILNDADAEIRAVDAEIEQVKAQKRGLMQKLLTGEWRVPESIHIEDAA